MISVCIPTYNQAIYLEECVASILAQDTLPCEIIISDDCSTDNTKNVLAKLAKDNSILKILYQPVNLGITANTNACFKVATGDYIVRLGSDDTLCNKFITRLSGLLSKYPDAGYAHCACNEIDEKGNIVSQRILHRFKEYENSADALRNTLKGYKVAANIIMFRKEALQKVGFINCAYNFGEDYYLAADITAHGFGNVYAPEILANYRVWSDANNIRIKRKLEEINGLRDVFNRIIEPAFKGKNFSFLPIQKAKAQFAKTQANCLAWKFYNKDEKNELKDALLLLSPTKEVRLVCYLYENNLNFFINYFESVKNLIKRFIKQTVRFFKK